MTDTIETRWESHNEAGRRYFAQGDFANAEHAFAAAIREATQLGPDNVRLASSLGNLGQLKYKQKDFAQAETLFHRSLAIRERVLGPEHFGLVQNINNLAALHYTRGDLEQAEPLFQRALAISEKHLGASHPDVAVTLNNLARLYFRRTDYKAAAPLLLRLLAIKQETLGATHPEVAAILTSLAKVRHAEGEYDAGEQLARRALDIREKIHVPNDPVIATSLETLAEICGARGKHDEEMELRARARAIREASSGADQAAVTAARATLAPRRGSAETARLDEPAVERSGPAAIAEVAPPTPAPEPARRDSARISTRSKSLPWIEPPTSPALRRRVPTPAGSAVLEDRSPAAVVYTRPDELTRFTPPASPPPPAPTPEEPPEAPRLAAPPLPSVDAHASDVLAADAGAPTRESELEWPLEPTRPWLKIAAVIGAIAVLAAGGGWYVKSRGTAPSDVRASVGTAAAAMLPAKPALTVAPEKPPVSTPAPVADARVPAKIAPAPEAPPPKPALAEKPERTKARAAEAPPPEPVTTAPEEPAVPPLGRAGVSLPTVKMNAITKAIEDSAQRRADSLSRAIPVKPPTFSKGKPGTIPDRR